jgi:hypothetical protein
MDNDNFGNKSVKEKVSLYEKTIGTILKKADNKTPQKQNNLKLEHKDDFYTPIIIKKNPEQNKPEQNKPEPKNLKQDIDNENKKINKYGDGRGTATQMRQDEIAKIKKELNLTHKEAVNEYTKRNPPKKYEPTVNPRGRPKK